MMKWLTAAVLIVALAGSVLAGAPLGTEGHSCPMMQEGAMDCCMIAEMQSGAPEVLAAKICCLVNCPQPGTTETNSPQRLSPTSSVNATHSTAHAPAVLPNTTTRRFNQSQSVAAHSPPPYLLNLALLI